MGSKYPHTVSDVTKSLYGNGLSVYIKFVTSQTASFPRADISKDGTIPFFISEDFPEL